MTLQQYKIVSPSVQWKQLRGYQLKNLKKDFQIASFERTASAKHIKQIVDAITTNNFYDNVIRVVKNKKTGKYAVIDAQHRLQALFIAHKEYGLKKYDLMLAIYSEKFARTTYRRLNMGKRLLTRDHSMALDDGSKPFFNELRPYLSHQKTASKSSFLEMLHALNYAKGRTRPVQIMQLDDLISSVTPDEIKILKEFSHAMQVFSPVVPRSFAFSMLVYRTVFRIGYENNFSKDEFLDLVEKASQNKKIQEMYKFRRQTDLNLAYKIICKDCKIKEVLQK